MSQEDITSLFAVAATRAADFRRSVQTRQQRPLKNLAGSMVEFEEALPATGSPMPDVFFQLIEKAEPGLQMPTGTLALASSAG